MDQELQAREKVHVKAEGEPTKSGPIFVPAVDIYESEKGMTLVADIPGVNKESLSIDLRDNTLSIRAQVGKTLPEGHKVIYREYEEGDFFRQFALSEVIDQTKITAALKDGVLTLFLPKAEPTQPRRIVVSA
ncbi:MAG: Hsp20/alpha crystallin family protein [Deltaproteobacteria bacterium]|nr:Hsp20/alpha crystallin family protein [Deltaproteobacteria bacterium]